MSHEDEMDETAAESQDEPVGGFAADESAEATTVEQAAEDA